MMAFDSRSTPEPRSLSESTLSAMREAVERVWNDPDGAEPVMQGALAQVVAEARARSLRAEEVIVSFKALLAAVPELNSSVRRLEAARLRERLITLCIKAYYSA